MVLIVTDPARDKILELRAQEDEPDALGLRIEVTGVQGVEYTYDLTFDPLGGAHIELSGTVEERVRQLLDGQINPSLAMHGGFAALDRVEDDKVYVTMGGGCQGCAVSAMTLREGIARSITEAIPEVSEVIDTTDHEQGENPYFT